MAVRRERSTGRSSYSRRESFEPRRAKEPSVDPTLHVNMCVFLRGGITVNWRADMRTSGVNLDTAVRFVDPDFLLECKISAIWRRFPLIFAFYILNVRHISTFGLFDLLT